MWDDNKNVTRTGDARGKNAERTLYETANTGYPRRRISKTNETTTVMKDQGGFVRYITTKENQDEDLMLYHFYVSYKHVDGVEGAIPVVKSTKVKAPGVVKLNTPSTVDGLFDLYNSTTRTADEEPSATTAEKLFLAEYGYTSLTTPVNLDSEGWIYAQSLHEVATPTRFALVHKKEGETHKYYYGNDLHGKLHFQRAFVTGSTAWSADNSWKNPDAYVSRTSTCQPHTRLVDLSTGEGEVLSSRGALKSKAILFDFARYYSPERGWPMLGRHGHIYKAPDGTKFLVYSSSSQLAESLKGGGSKYQNDYAGTGTAFVIQVARLIDVTKNGLSALTTILNYAPTISVSGKVALHTEFSPSGARVAFNVLAYPTDADVTYLDNSFWDIRLSTYAPYIIESVISGGSAAELPTATASVVRKVTDMDKKTTNKAPVAYTRSWGTNETYGHPISGVLTEMRNGAMFDYYLCEGVVTIIEGSEGFITPKKTKQTLALYASYGTDETLNVYDYEEETEESLQASYTIPSGTYLYTYKSGVYYHPVYLTPIEQGPITFVSPPENALSISDQTWTYTQTTSLLKNGSVHKRSSYSRVAHRMETTATTLFFINTPTAWEYAYTPKATGGGVSEGTISVSGDIGRPVLSSNNTFVWTAVNVIGIEQGGVVITDPTSQVQASLTPSGEAETISYPDHFPMDSDFRLWVSWNPLTDETTHFHGERWV